MRVADRKSLLLGTALASTILLGSFLAPAPALAVDCVQPAPPAPIIEFNVPNPVTCVNLADRNNDGVSNVILITTTGVGSYIDLYNSGELTANFAAAAYGINTAVAGGDSFIMIENLGDISATSTGNNAFGISARVYDATITPVDSPITILNSGDLTVSAPAGEAFGIIAESGNFTRGADVSPIMITNSGALMVSAMSDAFGIRARSYGVESDISIMNSGDFMIISTGDDTYGIFARSNGGSSPINVMNSGDFTLTSTTDEAAGIQADTTGDGSRSASRIAAISR